MTQHHPDDELLSAALDGEPEPATVAHLGGCDACLARLDALDRVRRAVGTGPGATPADVADRALGAAAAAWAGEQAAALVAVPEPEREPAAGGPAPTPPRPGPAGGDGTARGDDNVVPLPRRPDRRTFPPWALGAVAALVAVLLAVPMVLDDDSDTGQRTASSDGVFPAALREQLLRAVPGAVAQKAPAPPGADEAADTLAAPAPEAAARNAGGAGAAATACRAEVRAEFGGRLGALLYAASLRWQDTDAVVLAYRLADTSAPGPDHLAVVIARDDCRLLASQGF